MKSLFTIFACALIGATASARDLDVAEAKKAEIRHSMMGPRDTLIFYTFAEQDAVLQLDITHEAGKFTLSGKVQLFKEGTGAKEIGKWINNQHSDGLYPEVPKPVATVELPAEACTVVESKAKENADLATSPVTNDKFQDYALKIKVADIKSDKGFTLKGFTADAGAYAKVGPAS